MGFDRALKVIAAAATVWTTFACNDDAASRDPTADPREPCARRNRLRDVYFGDLHVHTSLSFDAWVFDVRTTPADAFRFARGESIPHPLGAPGTVSLSRPLDFAAVTDHAEYLGEVDLCTTPGSEVFDSPTCTGYRQADDDAVVDFGLRLTTSDPRRFSDVCGRDGARCRTLARDIWARIQETADAAYDKTSECRFTAFIGYEWTSAISASNLHRNIIFRNSRVPSTVSSYFEYPDVRTLHRILEATCLDSDDGCDVIAIPHNTNWSNGNMFFVEYPGADSVEEEREQASLRRQLEPLFEIYQHKGDMECQNGLSGILGEPDELCRFEKLRPEAPEVDCLDTPGFGGSGGVGCVSRLDFLRGILLEGLKEERRIGVNPYRLGVIASTDTHNGTPGRVSEKDYAGHWGNNEDTVDKRLGRGNITPGGVIYSGGGLTAAWAEQNTRESLFAAFRRREVYGTSGPRMTVRFFGGWGYPGDLCERPDFAEVGYADGVPMGADLPARPGAATAPRFAVSALMDAGTEGAPGVPLERIQIVKGWLDAQGGVHAKVFDVAGGDDGSSVDLLTCDRDSRGAPELCTVWTDPEFDPSQPAYYYARVLEDPTCRWSWWACLDLEESQRPESCSDDEIQKIIRERAWTSPIWYTPGA